MYKITTEFLYSRLPAVYREEDANIGYPLKRFLNILVEGGFKLAEKDIIDYLNLFNADKCPAKFLPHLGSLLGFEFPFDMPEQVQRKFIKNAARLYRMKGTKASLQFLISELIGFPAVITDEDVINKTFVVDITASGEDPDLEAKQRKIIQLLEAYKPMGSKFSILTAYLYKDILNMTFEEEEDTIASRPRLNIVGGFRLNTKGDWLNSRDIVYSYRG